MRSNIIEKIIRRDRGDDAYSQYVSCSNLSPEALAEAVQKTLVSVPPFFGSCVMISAGLVAALRYCYSIEAIAVLGDLKIDGFHIFKCKGNVPMPSYEDELIQGQWDGHCWVEVGDMICDLSIFRTAYAAEPPSLLKSYIMSNFGEGKGALVSPFESIPAELAFQPKYVLNDSQISGILGGLSAQSKGLI